MAGRQSPFGTSDCQGGFLRSLDLRRELVHLQQVPVSQRTCSRGYRIARGEQRSLRGSATLLWIDQKKTLESWLQGRLPFIRESLGSSVTRLPLDDRQK